MNILSCINDEQLVPISFMAGVSYVRAKIDVMCPLVIDQSLMFWMHVKASELKEHRPKKILKKLFENHLSSWKLFELIKVIWTHKVFLFCHFVRDVDINVTITYAWFMLNSNDMFKRELHIQSMLFIVKKKSPIAIIPKKSF